MDKLGLGMLNCAFFFANSKLVVEAHVLGVHKIAFAHTLNVRIYLGELEGVGLGLVRLQDLE